MKYKCIASDLDNTLLGPGSSLSDLTVSTLTTLMEHGISFVPATGRCYHAFPESLKKLPKIEYAITENGVSIINLPKERVVEASVVPEDLVERLFELLKGEFVTYEAFIDGRAYTQQSYFDHPSEYGVSLSVHEYIHRTRTAVPDIREFLRENRMHLDCVDVIVPPQRKDVVFEKVQSKLLDAYVTTSADHLVEISSQYSGKHNGLKRLVKYMGIDISEVVAFGDGDNDAMMLKEAGLGVAVGNASKNCKEAADLVTEKNDEDGVPKALRRIFYEFFE